MGVQEKNSPFRLNPSVHHTSEVRNAWVKWDENPVVLEAGARYRVLLLCDGYEQYLSFSRHFARNLTVEPFSSADDLLEALLAGYPADAIVASVNQGGWGFLKAIRSDARLSGMPIILLTKHLSKSIVQKARAQKADDIFDENFTEGDLILRLHFLFKRKWYVNSQAARKVQSLHVDTPLWKRIGDIFVVGSALLVLSPVFLLVSLVIRLDSKGPVFYKSKRAGSGFKIFDLYKFRTMRTNADQFINDMTDLNIYNQTTDTKAAPFSLCASCREKELHACERLLFWDGQEICERIYLREKDQKAAFMKFQNDPRITRVGKFLRNSSLDELPQLVNILKGDMSLVGNRPLPIYEAEKLTTDDKILRFVGPAGLTGYWQVTKRGKGKAEISERERIEMDIYYVKNFSFLLDLKIILKTFPALFQSESV